ncbi:MAG: hypothetical protein BZ135_01355 [Methanosphaera sp. rholeuAM6]|nr:MAG: hypothetical protein BZ135_01355 [Methanosphaera sp. rholeuAM6]
MAKELVNDDFLTMNDDFEEYIKYVNLLLTDYYEIVDKIDKIIENNVFSSETYIELTGIMKYASKRVFPLLLAFFGQDENFEDDIYPEFMDIQLMVLYLFDKLQYELDEALLNYNVSDVLVYEEIINLESINYLLKIILPQLSLFTKVFDLKIQFIDGTIDDVEFERKMVEIHDTMFI